MSAPTVGEGGAKRRVRVEVMTLVSLGFCGSGEIGARQRFFHKRIRFFDVSFDAEVAGLFGGECAFFGEGNGERMDCFEFRESLFNHRVVERLHLRRLLAFQLQADSGVVVDMNQAVRDGTVVVGRVGGVPILPPFGMILETVSDYSLLPLQNYTSPVVPPYLEGPPQQ